MNNVVSVLTHQLIEVILKQLITLEQGTFSDVDPVWVCLLPPSPKLMVQLDLDLVGTCICGDARQTKGNSQC